MRAEGIRVVPVNVANKSSDPEHYSNLRAELWHGLANWIRKGGMLPDDSKLSSELATPRYDQKGPRGSLRIEAKDEFKKRLKRSPDRAEALMLAVYGAGGGPMVAGPSLVDPRTRRPREGASRWSGYSAQRGFG
jgi:hypothetical protein